ncbi:MAG: hypothetical protein AAFP76_01405 [Bacteroidota bacterium]
MERIWIIAIAIFLVLGFLYYKSLKGYVKEAFGKRWLQIWGNKLYFWQSLLFISTASTVLVMYALKWSNVLTF